MTALFRSTLLMFAVALVGVGCASGASSSRASSVTFYESEDDIDGEFELIGPLEASSRSGYGASDPLVQLKAQAAQLGANGVLAVTDPDEIADARIRTAMGTQRSYTRTQYFAIYVRPSARPRGQ